MTKYRIKTGWEDTTVCTVAPFYRNGNGRFDLSLCTQRDLRYLHNIIKHRSVEVVINEQKEYTEKTE